jgi:glycosyltransferase involved in cell wall biosynthesis
VIPYAIASPVAGDSDADAHDGEAAGGDRAPRGAGPLVASFGYVRQGQVFIRAAAQVAARVPGVRFAFAGAHPDPHEAERLAALERELGVTVEHTGWLEPQERARRLAATEVAVQLRPGGRGEASGAVGDCLAAGVPTIVNDVGSHHDVPADALLRIGSDPDPDHVAAAIEHLLRDSAERARLAAAGRSFARAHSFAVTAAAVVDALDLFVDQHTGC